ncbi:MAG: protease inhibitor I42 family protein [Verrucomicrobiota bacterium]
MARFSLILFASLLFVGCETTSGSASDADGPREPISKTIGLASNGEQLNLRVGDTLNVSLPQNPTTGYSWNSIGVMDGVLTRQGNAQTKSLTTDGNNPQLIGAPSETVWTYQATEAGEAKLEYEYVRSWEKNTQPSKVFTVKVIVSP